MTSVSVIDPPFLLGLALVTALTIAASWIPMARRWLRWGVRSLGLVLTIAMAAAAVNARFAYFPTLATVLGRTATDQISAAELRTLTHAGRPGEVGRSRGGLLST